MKNINMSIIKFISRISDYLYETLLFIQDKINVFDLKKVLKLVIKILLFILIFWIVKAFIVPLASIFAVIIDSFSNVLKGTFANILIFALYNFYYLYFYLSLYKFIKHLIEEKDVNIFKSDVINKQLVKINEFVLKILKVILYIFLLPIFGIVLLGVILFIYLVFLAIKGNIIISLFLIAIALIIATIYLLKYIIGFIHDKNLKNYKYIAIFTYSSILIFTLIFFLVETRKYKVISDIKTLELSKYTLTYQIEKGIEISTSGFYEIKYDEKVKKGNLKIRFENYETSSYTLDTKKDNDKTKVNINYYINLTTDNLINISKTVNESLQNKYFYDYSKIKYGKVVISVNPKDKGLLKVIKNAK